jgi:ABC-type transporter Mla subunit MlaD
LHRAGDADGLAKATPRAIAWFADRPQALADLAAAATTVPGVAVQLLHGARRAGLPAANLQDERFAPLRSEPGFAELAGEPDKQ